MHRVAVWNTHTGRLFEKHFALGTEEDVRKEKLGRMGRDELEGGCDPTED